MKRPVPLAIVLFILIVGEFPYLVLVPFIIYLFRISVVAQLRQSPFHSKYKYGG